MAEIKFHDKLTVSGSNMIRVNVDRDGKPFAQIFTFKDTKNEKYPWVASLLSGENVTFFGGNKSKALTKAKDWVASCAS